MPVASNLVQFLYDAPHRVPAYVSLAACVGFAFLLALYLSQRRDLMRLPRIPKSWHLAATSCPSPAPTASPSSRWLASSTECAEK